MKRHFPPGFIHQAHSLAIFADVARNNIAVNRDVRLYQVGPLPAQRIEHHHRNAGMQRNAHALGDVAERVAQDLPAAYDGQLGIAPLALVARPAALAVVVVVGGFDQLFP